MTDEISAEHAPTFSPTKPRARDSAGNTAEITIRRVRDSASLVITGLNVSEKVSRSVPNS